MSDTPRTDAAYFAEGATMYDLAGEAKKMERELNEANADRLRLREALKPLVKMDDLMNDESWDEGGTYSGAYYAYYKGNSKKWAAAKESLTTPPPPVVAKADADALADELDEANADRQRLREALTQAGAGQFLDTISATPPPPVVDKRDADALADAITNHVIDAAVHFEEVDDIRLIREALEAYRTKYP